MFGQKQTGYMGGVREGYLIEIRLKRSLENIMRFYSNDIQGRLDGSAFIGLNLIPGLSPDFWPYEKLGPSFNKS